jgi:hypothetical protein
LPSQRAGGAPPTASSGILPEPALVLNARLRKEPVRVVAPGISRTLLNLELGTLLVEHDIHDGAREAGIGALVQSGSLRTQTLKESVFE